MAEPSRDPVTPLDRAALVQADPAILSGANWFWWIAGLSLVNTLLIHGGSDTSFVIGLGFTLLADAIFRESLLLVALLIDSVALGTIFTLGYFSRRGYLWAFVTGIILYVGDALIYLVLGDMMSLGFHCFALFFIIRGARQLHAALKSAEAALPPPPVPPVIT